MPSVPKLAFDGLLDVSVVIPVYNREDLISRAVDSVLKQRNCCFEVIVVDDGSSDETVSVLKGYGEEIQLLEQSHAGRSAARNTGLLAARGEFIAFLDSDDEFVENKLSIQLAKHRENPGWLLSGHGILVAEVDQRRAQSPEMEREFSDRYMAVLDQFCFFPSVVMARREALLAVGGFETRYHGAEDLDLALKIALRGPIGVFADCLTMMHQHSGQTGRKQLAEMNAKVIERHLEQFADCFDDSKRTKLRKKLARYLLSMAKRQQGAERTELLNKAKSYDPKLTWKLSFWKLKLWG